LAVSILTTLFKAVADVASMPSTSQLISGKSMKRGGCGLLQLLPDVEEVLKHLAAMGEEVMKHLVAMGEEVLKHGIAKRRTRVIEQLNMFE